MNIRERLGLFRDEMQKQGVTHYIIPTCDYHMSEYVHSHFAARRYFSGFTGSAGTLLITLDNAYLWTDGRYFIQAEEQLKDTTVTLMKMGEPGVPSLDDVLRKELNESSTLGLDGRVISVSQGDNYEAICKLSHAKFDYSQDIVSTIWKDRPELPNGMLYVLSDKYTGKSLTEKVKELREKVLVKNDVYVDSVLDNIAWITNCRGKDVPCNPVFLSYILVGKDFFNLYIDNCKLNDEVTAYLNDNDVTIKAYNDIYDDLKVYSSSSVQLDKARANYLLYKSINESNVIVDSRSPIELAKAMKNSVEIEGLRNSHLKDGIAVTKFMYWLKKNVGKTLISEISAAKHLTSLRAEQEGFIEPSFGTIAGYRDHAAMMHYGATEASNYTLEPNGMFLVDSGGQYYDGTTDITRTFALGEVTDEMRKDFTLTLKGMICLSKQKFLYGCGGINLDILARHALWNQNIDYKCGTGHGVGFLLGVHEGPHGIRWKQTLTKTELITLEEGMVVTNEPGVYKEGEYGIRIENELVVRKGIENEYGQFMEFETITYAPIDLDLVVVDMLDKDEKQFLNDYHEMVRNKLTPYMNDEELVFLNEYTREV
ncbi:MAG: aminopeptidase P family protein [Erysipelotrichales bacterium]|nr:aminopeptidase P family protein [Erysipelotrichales bacterium]